MLKRRLALAYAFLGGALAWTLHLMAAYAIAEGLCVLDAPGVAWALSGLTALCLALALGAATVAWRLSARERDGEALLFGGGAGFVASAGLASDVLFSIVIVAQALPIAMLLGSC